MAVLDGYGRFLRVWKRMRWEKLAEEEFFAKNILRGKISAKKAAVRLE